MNRLALLAIAAAAVVTGGCTESGDADPLDGRHGALDDRLDRWFWVPRERFDMNWDPPSSAVVIAGGGDIQPDSAADDGADADPPDLDLQSAGRVQADGNGDVWILSGGRLDARSGITVLRLSGDEIGAAYPIHEVTGMAVSPDGSAYLSGNPSSNIDVVPSDRPDRRLDEVDVEAESLATSTDGTLYVGARGEQRIIALDAEGEPRDLLSVPVWDGPDSTGRVALLTVLNNGRLAFVAKGGEDDFTLWVIQDDGRAEPVGGDIEVASRQMVSTIGPTPDGDILVTTGSEIETVDVETGERTTIVDLSGAEGTFSATAVGDDLVFLADGRIWRMDGALAS